MLMLQQLVADAKATELIALWVKGRTRRFRGLLGFT